jgi:hypothetical protein
VSHTTPTHPQSRTGLAILHSPFLTQLADRRPPPPPHRISSAVSSSAPAPSPRLSPFSPQPAARSSPAAATTASRRTPPPPHIAGRRRLRAGALPPQTPPRGASSSAAANPSGRRLALRRGRTVSRSSAYLSAPRARPRDATAVTGIYSDDRQLLTDPPPPAHAGGEYASSFHLTSSISATFEAT